MLSTSQALFTIASIACYLLAAMSFWQRRHALLHPQPSQPLPAAIAGWHSPVIAAGLLAHALLLQSALFNAGLNLGFANALSIIAWLTVLIYWLTNLREPIPSLQAFVLPPAAFFVLLQTAMPQQHVLPYATDPLFLAHMVVALLAYSLFTFAALHATLMAMAERSLHQKTGRMRWMDFPPIITMEILLFRVIGVGFILLTLTLLSGILFSEEIFHQALKFNHKNIFTILSWLIFAALLIGRHLRGWRGRKAIRWTLTGFVLLVLAYAGSKFVLEVILQR